MTVSIEEIDALVEGASEADDVRREVVAALTAPEDVSWAGVALLDAGRLVLGPEAGTPDESKRVRTAVRFNGEPVGELLVDGSLGPELLEAVAGRIAPYVLIGWDTDGETWEP